MQMNPQWLDSRGEHTVVVVGKDVFNIIGAMVI